MMIKIKARPGVRLPVRMTPGAIGYDVKAVEHWIDRSDQIYCYSTGISIELPNGVACLCLPRSSVSKTGLALCNSLGLIDADYRGEIVFKFYRVGGGQAYRVGDRVGQLVFVPYVWPEFESVDKLSETWRGDGGYGSTGR